jgi:hypothetical protein
VSALSTDRARDNYDRPPVSSLIARCAPPEAIQNTLIAMAKAAYVRGDAEIDYLDAMVDAILRGRPTAILQPGERILRRDVSAAKQIPSVDNAVFCFVRPLP